MSYGFFCAWCGEQVWHENACTAWELDGTKVPIHNDIAVCNHNIRTNPDAPDAIEAASFPPLTLVGVREEEPRMTGALDPDRGWYR